MSLRHLAVGGATVVALLAPLPVQAAIPAAPPASSITTTTTDESRAESAAAAAAYIVAGVSEDGDLGGAGSTADGVLALVAAGGHEDTVELMTDWLETQAAAYAGNGGPAAGKIAIVAGATGRDATDFGGVDLIAAMDSSLLANGQCGSFGYAFGQALCILGYHRAGVEVPANVIEHIYNYQDEASGAFGYGSFTPDGDGSGMALMALAGVLEADGATDSAVRVRNYLRESQTEEGYWLNFSPVNTTGLVGPAMEIVGEDVELATTWMQSQQFEDGGLPSSLGGTTSNMMATTQGMLLFTGESYLTLGDPEAGPVELVLGPESVTRLYGSDRFATAAAVAAGFEPGVEVAYVATGSDYADALAVSALAGGQDVPVLLVRPGSVPSATAQALTDLEPQEIVVLGGSAAVADAVVEDLAAYTDGEVSRLAGTNRFHTAALISGEFAEADTVFVASGQEFPDALAGAARAAATDSPVLLVRQGQLPGVVAEELDRLQPSSIVLLGGSAVVSDEVEESLAEFGPVTRIAGADRFETSALIAGLWDSAEAAYVATGAGWPDGLTGAAAAGSQDAPLVLTKPGELSPVVADELVRLQAPQLVVLGGESVVSADVVDALVELNYAL